MFRFMDPETQRVMALRSDITPQLARIAITRFGTAPRPLRLAYAGDVVRFKGSTIRPTRQYGQLGAELVGDESIHSEAEIIRLSVESLEAASVKDITLDLTLPTLSELVIAAFAGDGPVNTVRELVLARDREALMGYGALGAQLAKIMDAAGPIEKAFDRLDKVSLPEPARQLLNRTQQLYATIKNGMPSVKVTLDPVETKGFDYKTGIGFALFGGGARSELGRGGRYSIPAADDTGEPAVGFSLYLDRVLEVVPMIEARPRILVIGEAPVETYLEQIDLQAEPVFVRLFDIDAERDLERMLDLHGCHFAFTNKGVFANPALTDD